MHAIVRDLAKQALYFMVNSRPTHPQTREIGLLIIAFPRGLSSFMAFLSSLEENRKQSIVPSNR
jgi:hypothetical protein